MTGWPRSTLQEELEKLQDTGYPLVLAAGERTDFNATSRMRNKDWMGNKQPCTLKMHPEDAKELGLDTGMNALVETERGSLELEVEVSEEPLPRDGDHPARLRSRALRRGAGRERELSHRGSKPRPAGRNASAQVRTLQGLGATRRDASESAARLTPSRGSVPGSGMMLENVSGSFTM